MNTFIELAEAQNDEQIAALLRRWAHFSGDTEDAETAREGLEKIEAQMEGRRK